MSMSEAPEPGPEGSGEMPWVSMMLTVEARQCPERRCVSKHTKNAVFTVFSGFIEVPGPSCGPRGGSLMLMMLAPVGGGYPPKT